MNTDLIVLYFIVRTLLFILVGGASLAPIVAWIILPEKSNKQESIKERLSRL